MEKIRIGVFGLVRGRDLLDCMTENDGEIVAVCDGDPQKLEKARSILGEKVALYQDFDRFFEHEMDAVFLANYFPDHARFAVRFLEKGVHVLSECLSNSTMADGVALVRAAEKSKATYMLAENYPYMLFNQEMKYICDGGSLGRILFAEGEYNHPISPLDTAFVRDRRPFPAHWRNYLPASYYITHSLAPLMHSTGGIPIKVCAMPVYMPLGDEYPSHTCTADQAAIITCLNHDNSVFRVTGCAAFGAHENSYRICGENGQIENVRGTDGKIMLRYNDWQIPEGMEATNFYEPSYRGENTEAAKKYGHGGGDFFVFKNFFESIRTGKKPPFDVYFATTAASVGILAHRSILAGSMPIDIPDFHKEEDRIQYENDTLTPFYGPNGEEPTLPCCSRPDYRPSKAQLEKYKEITGYDPIVK